MKDGDRSRGVGIYGKNVFLSIAGNVDLIVTFKIYEKVGWRNGVF